MPGSCLQARRRVRQDHVQFVQGQVREQAIRLSLPADQAYLTERLQGRLQEPLCNELGHHVGNADGHAEGATDRTVVERVLHLPAQAEDLLGVSVDHPAALRQHQAAAALGEELVAQPLLKQANLAADRGRREAEFLTGLCQAALAATIQK